MGPFLVQNFAIFAQKSGFWLLSWKPLIRISRNLVRNLHDWDNCFQSFNGSVVSGKILVLAVLAVWPIFGQKYIACGDKLRFLTIFDQFLPICWCLFDNFCLFFLNQVYGLRRDKVNLGCDKKFFGHFRTFFGSKFCHFCSKIRFLAVFLKTAYQNFT